MAILQKSRFAKTKTSRKVKSPRGPNLTTRLCGDSAYYIGARKCSALHAKAVFAFRTKHSVISLCLRQSEDRLARGTLAVNVRLSILELVFTKPEEAAKAFVFLAPFCDIP